MVKHKITLSLSLLVLALYGSPAFATDELVNNGLIDQVADIKNAVELKQRQSVGSIQAINLVASGDRLVNNGTIRQTVRADNVRMEQRQSLSSTQALNAVTAGNPAASGFGF